MVAATHQGSHSSVECPNIPVITEVKVTTQKNEERTLSMRNSNEKKNYLVEVQVYQSKNYKETSFGYPKTDGDGQMQGSGLIGHNEQMEHLSYLKAWSSLFLLVS